MDSVAAAVAALRKHHNASRVVVVGHSGGAANAGVILGRAAPLVDVAVLILSLQYSGLARSARAVGVAECRLAA